MSCMIPEKIDFKAGFFIFIFVLVSSWNGILAQDFKKVDFYLKDSTQGKASYSVLKSKRKDLKNGKFEFSSTQVDTTTKAIKSTQYTGFYNDNIKNQKWKFSFLELNSESTSMVKDYELVRETSGTEFLIEGNFLDGKPDNEWRVVKHHVKNSKVGDTIFFLKAHFKAGQLNGDLWSYNEKLSMKGQFDAQSFLDGHWIVKHKIPENIKVEEHRIYQNGIFKSHYFMIENQQVLVQHVGLDIIPDLENEIWVDVPVSEEYFNIISFANTGYNMDNIHLPKEKLDSLVELTHDISKRALISYGDFRNTQIWNQLDGSDEFQYPVFKLRKYELTATEKKGIKETVSKINKIQQKIDDFLQKPELDVILFAYKDLNLYHEWLKIHSQEFQKINEFSKKIKNPAFEFINRKDFFEIIKPEVNFPSQFDYYFNNEKFTAQSTIQNLKSIPSYDWEQIQQFISKIEKDIDATIEKAHVFLVRYQRQTALKDRELLLIQKRDSVLEIFNPDNKREDFNVHHLKVAPIIIEFTNQTFKAYASKSLEEKKEEVDSYIQCMDDVLTFYEKWKDIPRRLNRLDELYTRTTFNPHVFTNMDERVKARLYETYEEMLLPYFLEEAIQNLTCESVLKSALDFEVLYRKMVDLREQDTKILERQLRRVKTPMEAIQILNLELN